MAETPRRRGQYSVGLATRAKIISVAVRHFARYGYGRSSLGRVAREVGISEAGLLHHFASKEELLLQVLRHNEEQYSQALAEAHLPNSGTGYLELLVWCADRNVDRAGMVQLFVRMSAEATAEDHPAHTWFVERYQRLVDLIAAHLRIGVDAGELRAETDCFEVARELIAVSDGLQIQWLLSGRSFDLPAAYRAHVGRVRADITTRVGDVRADAEGKAQGGESSGS